MSGSGKKVEMTVGVAGSDHPEKMRKIKECHYYIAFATPAFFESAQCFAEALYAKELGKPFRILVKKGTIIDLSYFEGVDDIKYYHFNTPEECSECLYRILKEARDDARRRSMS